ncbi:hypothetical protein; putative signal peptide [Alloactinosynnema sp. L-07]|uniref:hypothetical protein n=1 Tax=Alloactinosynnema sp. L-07 TaxID=1653480 RepID=UPI00065F0A96|nr:hypothetical protein [Alloactinosynnema sp. L-07]CRK59272.1 hypothetical protein; putative signal peptide [Alloactinosynnema sp. L-07]
MIKTIAAVLAAAAVAGCTTTANPPSQADEPPLDTVAQLTVARGLSTPLDAYRPDPQQRATLATARELLIRVCMAGFGFAWPVLARSVEPDTDRRYGITDPAEARRFGYRLPPDKAGGVNAPAPGGAASPIAYKILSGQTRQTTEGKHVPEGGCAAEADRSLGFEVAIRDGGMIEVSNLPQRLENEARHGYKSDSRTAQVDAAWAACMRDTGFGRAGNGRDYASWRDPNDTYSQGQVSQLEIDTALADIECKNKHNVAGISHAVETAYQRRLIERDAEALTEEKQKHEERVRHATELVAKG